MPGGGFSLDGERWVSCRPRFLLPVRVLSKLFRGLLLAKLLAAHAAGKLQFFGKQAALTERKAFAAYLAPLRKINWYVYSKRPFGGPKAVLAYLSRYTHRVAISNRRLIALDSRGVTFKYKDYRADGRARHKLMTLVTAEPSAASSSTFCPTASIAFAITVSSPALLAPTTSRGHVSCSMRLRRKTNPTMQRPPSRMSQRRWRSPVRAAAAA